MKVSKLRTIWIIFVTALIIANTCAQSVLKALFGKINRIWVNKNIQIMANRVLNLAGITCYVINPLNVQPKKGQATILMCNHTSLYDIPISFKAFPEHSIRMLAKKELSNIPILGKGMKSADFPFIDRKNRQQAIKDLNIVRKLLESGIVMWIAPEGTRSKDGKLAAFKKGGFITAINAKATIIPIYIHGAYDILPARTYQLNINQTAEIHVGEPVDASEYTLDTKEDLKNTVFERMQALSVKAKAIPAST